MTEPTASSPRELPLFPLGTVQFPGLPLDLQVFESRYLQLLEDLATGESQEFGIVAISSGHEVGAENLHGIAEVGCAVRIERTQPAGGRVVLRAIGTWRFGGIEIVDRGTPYLVARVQPLPQDPVSAAEPEATDALRSALFAYATAADLQLGAVPADLDALGWWIAAGGPLTQAERLRLLGMARAERWELLGRWLRREARLLTSTHTVPFEGDRRQSIN
ncbi:MAG: LON peptidase substrate-binding domain-containing protein [Propionibacteriaceae bacterium]|nr:LON peptidase substrate-binding domain-containing protein [Propionibacteriaceae bacterium]